MISTLDAVNKLLRAIGESPVSSLTSGLADAETAERILREVTEDVLSTGWHSNSDEAVVFAPDVSGHIVISPTILKIDTMGRDRYINVIPRVDPTDERRKLFNLREQTYVFTRSLVCDVVYSFEFDSLTHSLRRYIASKAALKFQADMMSSVALDQMLARETADAWAALQDEEAESEDLNILDSSPHCRYIARRNDGRR